MIQVWPFFQNINMLLFITIVPCYHDLSMQKQVRSFEEFVLYTQKFFINVMWMGNYRISKCHMTTLLYMVRYCHV